MDLIRQFINFLGYCFRCKEDAVHQVCARICLYSQLFIHIRTHIINLCKLADIAHKIKAFGIKITHKFDCIMYILSIYLHSHRTFQFQSNRLNMHFCNQYVYYFECFFLGGGNFFQNSETNERTHLLQHPINSSPAVIANNGNLLRDSQNSVPQKNESNALNRIVQDFAT